MRFISSALAAFTVLASSVAAQVPGVTQDTIRLGQSCALKGPARALGIGMRTGLNVYFDVVNERGGIEGRKIELKSVNDGYEPKRCTMVTSKLINQDKVFLLIGEVGTPTSKVAVPLAEKNGVPFIAPFTGAEFLRNPHRELVVNVRGSYYQEMEALAKHLVDSQGMQRIACFYQNDGYGKAGLNGIVRALKRRGLKLVSTGTYKRNTVAVKPGLDEVSAGNPQAVVMVGAYRPCAEFILQGKKRSTLAGLTYCNISFVGTKALAKQLKGNDANCIVSQVVPYPWDQRVPLVREFTKHMKAAGRASEIGFITLEGYMGAKLFCMAAEAVEGRLTRESFLAVIAKRGSFDLGGVVLDYSKTDNQGMDQVFLTRLNKGRIEKLVQATATPVK